MERRCSSTPEAVAESLSSAQLTGATSSANAQRGRTVESGGGDRGDGDESACSSAHTHPDYPALPLKNTSLYKYGTQVNLKYPGLQCIFESPCSGAPVFIIPNFLSAEECDRFQARCSGELRPSDHGQVSKNPATRNSRHVRVVKEETATFHARVADLTNHRVENMETVKLVRYQKDEEFSLHMDPQATPIDDMASLDGRPLPDYVNRELTLFVYLNTVAEGGETAFFGWDPDSKTYFETFRVRPERGLAVLFYVSLQPPSGELPSDLSGYMDRQCLRDRYSAHEGRPAVDDKYLLAQWIWPVNVNRDESLRDREVSLEARTTGGPIM